MQGLVDAGLVEMRDARYAARLQRGLRHGVGDVERIETAAQQGLDLVDEHFAYGAQLALEAMALAQQARC